MRDPVVFKNIDFFLNFLLGLTYIINRRMSHSSLLYSLDIKNKSNDDLKILSQVGDRARSELKRRLTEKNNTCSVCSRKLDTFLSKCSKCLAESCYY